MILLLTTMLQIGSIDATIAKPEVVLYLDVNGTVTCKDSLLYSDDVHPGLLIDIARNVQGIWEQGLPAMSFVQYMEQHKYKDSGEKRDREYKRIFSYLTPEQQDFWRARYQAGVGKLQEMGQKKVFTSLIKAIKWLKAEKTSFQVLLRTYGSDAKSVMEEVNRELQEPFFDCKIHTLTYAEDGSFMLQTEGQKTAEKVSRVQLATRLTSLGNSAVRDDYNAWHSHGEVGKWGKPFPVDVTQESYFFDDWEGANTTIALFDAQTGETFDVDPVRVPPTSTFEMLLNDEAIVSVIR